MGLIDWDSQRDDWDEWFRRVSSREEHVPNNPSRDCDDGSLRQQCLCFLAGMALFLPLGTQVVSSVQARLRVAAKRPPAKVRATVPMAAQKVPTPRIQGCERSHPKRRFLALNTGSRLSLFSLEPDGSIGSKPTDVLPLDSIQDPELDSFFQGSQLVVHPSLPVLYECSLDATKEKLSVYAYSIDPKGKLTRLGQRPFTFDTQNYKFRGNGSGVVACLDPTGTYLYFTQNSFGGATGQSPEIPYFHIDSQGIIEERPSTVRLDLPQDKYYSICLEPGRTGSNDLYAYTAACDSTYIQRTAYHGKVLANGLFKMDSQVELRGGVFRTQSSDRFLRDGTWGAWEGLRLDEQGRILEAYHWPKPGASLYDMMPGYALGLKNSVHETEARVYLVNPENDRPTASSLAVTMPRIYELGKVLGDAVTQQVFLFVESPDRGIEVVRVGLRNGTLRSFSPQKLDDFGFLTSSYGKVQIVSIY